MSSAPIGTVSRSYIFNCLYFLKKSLKTGINTDLKLLKSIYVDKGSQPLALWYNVSFGSDAQHKESKE